MDPERRASPMKIFFLGCFALIAGCTRGPDPAPAGYHAARAATKPEEIRREQATPIVLPSPTPRPSPSSSSSVGGVTWDATPPLSPRPPSSSMRAAEYVVTDSSGDAVLAVFFFGAGQGGSVQDNLDRWIGQITQPDGADSKTRANVERREVGGLEVTTVELAGNITGAMPGAGETEAQRDQQLLGAIAAGPEGPVFFKFTGPRATVERSRAAFEALVMSLRADLPPPK